MSYMSLNLPKLFYGCYFPSILTANENGKCFCSHPTDEETKVWRGVLNYPKPESEDFTSPGGELTSQGVRNSVIAKLRDRA